MRDVSHKYRSLRVATAEALLRVSPTTISAIREERIPKGDALEIARVAAIQAAKNTAQIVPYCHQVPLDHVGVNFELSESWIRIQTIVKAIYKTGVEMEAMVAASIAALTLYDMLKMLDHTMEITSIRILSKKGGKSDNPVPLPRSLNAAVVVISDSCSAGTKDDTSGKAIAGRLAHDGIAVIERKIIPDDVDAIVATLTALCDHDHPDLILTTGGTGLGPRDVTPEATARVIERETPGIAESIRSFGTERTPYAALSRGKAGIRGNSLIVNLPGSERGVSESLDILLPILPHAFLTLWGTGKAHVDAREG